MEVSQSFAKRRLSPSQTRARSITHRRGRTSKPRATPCHLMIAMRQSPLRAPRQLWSGITAISEDVAQLPTIKPSVSTAACRLWLLISFPAPKSHGPPLSVVFTHWLSIVPAEGLDPPFQFARHRDHQVIDGARQATVSPAVEMELDRGKGWEVPRQQAPLAAGRGDVLDRAHRIAQVRRAEATEALGPGRSGAIRPHSRPVKSLELRRSRRAWSRRAASVQAIGGSTRSRRQMEAHLLISLRFFRVGPSERV